MNPVVPLEEMIEGSSKLYDDLGDLLGDLEIDAGHRVDLTLTLCSLALEHSTSILSLIALGNPSSALALVRVQFEVIVRASWIYFAATDERVKKCVTPLSPEALKEPDLFPSISDMLSHLEGKAPVPLVRALTEFKNAAWGAMNSWVHGNLRPMVGARNGYRQELLSQTIQNANGASMFCGLMIGQAAEDLDVSLGIIRISTSHARYLPPFHPSGIGKHQLWIPNR